MDSINLTILTGAGISAESGIPTFRDSKTGLWENHKVEDVATPAAFARDPGLVHRFYNQRRAVLDTVEPNAAHYALAKLEKYWTEKDIGGFLLITQNIDDLHERAGSKNIAHMHGEARKIRCTNCGDITNFGGANCLPEHICGACMFVGSLRPHVVWFGEMPLYLDAIEKVLDRTHHYIAIGTSGTVMPASLFAECVTTNGMYSELNEIVEITKESTSNRAFTIQINEKATIAVPEYVDLLIEQVEELRGDRK